jgi:signal transduction histidine kinase
MLLPVRNYLILALLIVVSALAALAISLTAFGWEVNQYAYDFLFRLEPPQAWQPSSIILAIDERTLNRYGVGGIRAALADGLEKIAPAHPASVAVDIILAEAGPAEEDGRLEKAFADTHNLVLSSDLLPDGSGWEEPIARFRGHAAAVGEVHADLDKYDAVSRDIPLEKAAGRDRHWALALAAYSVAQGRDIFESPDDLTIGDTRIPSTFASGRTMRIRYAPAGLIPAIGIADLDRDPSLAARFAGKVVFAGVTAQNAVRDRWMTPYSNGVIMPGIEMHANVYETIARRLFLTDSWLVNVAAMCLILAAGAALGYALTMGWPANLVAFGMLVVSQLIPAIEFRYSTVWPWFPGTLAVAFGASTAAAWRHLLVRRQLIRSDREKGRYQKAIQFVTHEMRTPLTAIQGSSELISRYGSMPEAKRTQIADLINSESKRLARMIETFLSVERLSEDEMELRQERFDIGELVDRCAERARPLAERKQIEIEVEPLPAAELSGDRELMEYAVYNLLTNAVKYSPPQTRVTVYGEDGRGDRVRLSIRDQGIGMDKKEVRRIFEKFYRTKRAEQSGEVGTGIGLSLVEQIVLRHGGTIQVESEPGKGSQFTLVLKRASSLQTK